MRTIAKVDREKRNGFYGKEAIPMDQKNLFKLVSFVGLLIGGLGTLLSGWADDKQQEALIEEKVNEVLAARENAEKAEES